MMPGTRAVVALLALSACLVPTLRADGDPDGGWWSDLYARREVALEQVLASPAAFRGQTVTAVVQFNRISKLENPYYTCFGDDRYVNFSVWSDAAPLWDREAFRNHFPFMFVSRERPEAKEVLGAPHYSRWIMTGTVREVFKGMPWIEVRELRRLEEQMSEPALINIVKGFRLRDLRRYDAAASALQAADEKGLPREIRVMIMREEALCLHAAGRTLLAVSRLHEARSVLPHDGPTRDALIMCRRALGLDPLGPPPGRAATPEGSGVETPAAGSDR
jgi:hypothetical protein